MRGHYLDSRGTSQRKADRRYAHEYGSGKHSESESEDSEEYGCESQVHENDDTFYPDNVTSKSEETKLPSKN